ncbi:MAG: hydrogenase nickel incorporation protein HypB [Acidobacteria bacterium]|nr:hydrogenase nickel incorporation protein HypB [Acidobacteriota bacterium]
MDRIDLQKKILSRNDEIAAALAERFRRHNNYVMNMISSPGSGKTTLLEKLIPMFQARHLRVGVLEGDVQTENDARRIARLDVPVRQIITCGSCHLDAQMIEEHLDALPLPELELLFIENVGNLVCPSTYLLGEDDKMVVLSTAEGDDKPIKYPAVFRRAAVMVVNKIDLMELTDFDLDQAVHYARGIKPDVAVFPVSCRSGEGLDALCRWIVGRYEEKSQRVRK